MRRPLLALAAAFVAGCLLIDHEGTRAEAAALLGLAALLLAGALLASARAAVPALGFAALALGTAGAIVETLAFESGDLRQLLRGAEGGLTARLRGTVAVDPYVEQGRLRLLLAVESLEAGGHVRPARGRARVDVGGSGPFPRLAVGDRIAAWAALRPVSLGSAVRDGTAARGYCKSVRLLEVEATSARGLAAAAAGLRARARDAIVRHVLPGPERGLVLAMVLGDRSEIDDDTAGDFRASGTYHVLALSGAQVALVAGLLVFALRYCLVPPWPRALLAGAAVSCYALLVGGEVPVVRAALMAAAVLVGVALELDTDAANLLGLAALALLAAHPAAATDAGFQLSFGATLGILVLTGPLTQGWPRLPLRAEVAFAASIAAQAALGPVLAAWFHRLAPAALVLNIAAVPLASAVLLCGIALVAVAALAAILTPLAPLAGLCGDVAWVAARSLRVSGDLGVAEPWLDWRVAAPGFAALAAWVAGLALLARGRRAAGLLVLLAGQALLVAGRTPVIDGRLHLTMIDVGQGDALLLRSPAGRALLVDAGGSRESLRFDPGERRVAPELWRRGVRRLDALLVTHAHPDHVGGAPFILRAFRTAEVWQGPAPLADPVWRRVQRALQERPTGARALAAGMGFDWDGARVDVLGPLPPSRPPLRVRNEDSVVLAVRYGEVTLLLTGDVAGEAERAFAAPLSEVVKVPHHGSRSSSAAEFVAASSPRLALLSAGAHNPFGHPHPEVVERYLRAGALLLRSDRDGTVEVATDGRAVWVRPEREGMERRVR